MNVGLTTTGRNTGQPHKVSLYAFEDGDCLVVVGSRGGASKDPDWAKNLRATPQATVHQGRKLHQVHAHEAVGKERDPLWKLVTEAFPLYETYQRRTTRTIPLFVLEPSD